MRYRTHPMLAASLLLAVTGCAGSPRIVASPSACTSLLPVEWDKGVAGADLPAEAAPLPANASSAQMLDQARDELRKWAGFGVEQTGALDQANARYADGLGIVRRCEARDAEAVKAARPSFLGLF